MKASTSKMRLLKKKKVLHYIKKILQGFFFFLSRSPHTTSLIKKKNLRQDYKKLIYKRIFLEYIPKWGEPNQLKWLRIPFLQCSDVCVCVCVRESGFNAVSCLCGLICPKFIRRKLLPGTVVPAWSLVLVSLRADAWPELVVWSQPWKWLSHTPGEGKRRTVECVREK